MTKPTETTIAPTAQAQTGLAEKARSIDQIAARAAELFDGANSLEKTLAVGEAIQQLRAALTLDVMRPIMALMNTDLGFLTDRDPRKPTKREPNPTPYSVDVIKDVLIEANLRGFYPVGNEFNVISGRFYAAKNGLKRRCESWPGVTNLKILIGLPRNSKDGQGAVVAVVGTWEKDKQKDKIETEVAVRVNEFMGADAIVGKAERKLYKRIFDRLSGKVTPDGEVDDAEALPAAELPKVPPAPDPLANTNAKAAVAALDAQPKAEPEKAPEPTGYQDTVQETLCSIVIDAGFVFDDYAAWGRKRIGNGNLHTGPAPWDIIQSFADVPDKLAQFCVDNQQVMLGQMGVGRRGK